MTTSSGLVINGRFTVQSLSGVQRFAGEITRALARIWPEGAPSPRLLAPPGRLTESDGFGFAVEQAGRLKGQLWEQIDLPRLAGKRVLLNLGNTAPLFVRRQFVVLHDAAVFAQPQGYSWKFRLWYKILQMVLCRTGARFVTVSRFSQREIARHLGISADRISVIPEGGEHIRQTPADTSILDQHHLTGQRFVLAVGNLAPHKNLRALSTLARALDERGIPLVISGGANPSVFGAAAVLPHPALYVGRVTDGQLHALYQAASCFVFPSLYEGFGLPALEAMACGCPVVASSIPALQEVCGDAACYADPADENDIMAGVQRVLDEPGLSAQLREQGFARAALYTWDRAARALLALTEGAGVA
ncbi:glycosyltransferase family 4 protein [Acetobacter oeni]|uniref:Glycosyl transferase family 1 n=1 Tax=Acetobacter oeni TaxID=304077 RepID=A0A511XHI1_9PROT|nr:glycosyltransferase family 1 protein [Acetobacter oeni]MBB3881253.1 glycosyltransferase involved in cell wall biosynthesis [Acetobacter oeni]NHO18128.1 glycosyltransferase [Acetobacter oeni]GBR08204.1 glycosyltransferase [Acetobacter oeni LMG 21952]GEN62406.1 glycosyl transferase family 1 [Acetobacter oeni]